MLQSWRDRGTNCKEVTDTEQRPCVNEYTEQWNDLRGFRVLWLRVALGFRVSEIHSTTSIFSLNARRETLSVVFWDLYDCNCWFMFKYKRGKVWKHCKAKIKMLWSIHNMIVFKCIAFVIFCCDLCVYVYCISIGI